MSRRVNVGFRMDADELAEFDALLTHKGIRRSEALREAVAMWAADERPPRPKRDPGPNLTVDQIREIAAAHGVEHLLDGDGVIRLHLVGDLEEPA
jgi:hypothetical protein